jgi:hypothetical protein
LVERAQEQYNEEEARKLQKKIAKNEFGFDDFLSQIQQIKKMGSMKDLVGMIPGANKAMKDVEIEDDAFKHIEAIIHSMTPLERSKPSVLDMKNCQRFWYQDRSSKPIVKTIRPNEQNDENDARFGRKEFNESNGWNERNEIIYGRFLASFFLHINY